MTGDLHLQSDDQKARDDALDEKRSFIVQAPAGSGKTELLIQRYLRLLSFVDEPEEIIAITFTRKAAAEMQHRVLSALRAAQRGDRPEQEHQRRTAELATAALERDAQNDWHLLANPRRMRIAADQRARECQWCSHRRRCRTCIPASGGSHGDTRLHRDVRRSP